MRQDTAITRTRKRTNRANPTNPYEYMSIHAYPWVPSEIPIVTSRLGVAQPTRAVPRPSQGSRTCYSAEPAVSTDLAAAGRFRLEDPADGESNQGRRWPGRYRPPRKTALVLPEKTVSEVDVEGEERRSQPNMPVVAGLCCGNNRGGEQATQRELCRWRYRSCDQNTSISGVSNSCMPCPRSWCTETVRLDGRMAPQRPTAPAPRPAAAERDREQARSPAGSLARRTPPE